MDERGSLAQSSMHSRTVGQASSAARSGAISPAFRALLKARSYDSVRSTSAQATGTEGWA